MTTPRTLAFYEPGHFHAALTLRIKNPRVADEVHLYSTPGPDRDAFLGLVEAFNTRTDSPTAWKVIEHTGPDPGALLDALVSDGHADAVVLAGTHSTDGFDQAQRLVFVARLAVGELPDGQHILHECENLLKGRW